MLNTEARHLRSTMTEAEKRLWSLPRDRKLAGVKFRRQYPFDCYILDFACVELRLAVEADGGQHADNTADESRTAVLERHGWKILRFWNSDILANSAGVAEEILRVLRERTAKG